MNSQRSAVPSSALSSINIAETNSGNNVEQPGFTQMSLSDKDITPVLYSFKTAQSPYRGSIMTASLPPYWLYHDHAFGVIWCLFQPNRTPIGPSQLHWCLRFLLDLKSSTGEYTGDVKLCINAIEDDLIEAYTKLGQMLLQQSESRVEEKLNEIKVHRNMIENIRSATTNFTGNKPETDIDSIKSTVNDESDNSHLHTYPDFVLYSRYVATTPCEKTCEGKIHSGKAMSLTYEQMVSRGSDPYTKKTDKKPVGFETKTPEVVQELSKKLNETSLLDLETEELLNFLNTSRQQYVAKIKQEIVKLHTLEKFMGTIIDKHSFIPYITEDLANRLDTLRGRDVFKELDKLTE